LIEQIDVDLAEFHSQVGGHGRHIGGHPPMILRCETRPVAGQRIAANALQSVATS
jgi:hypothetical protein